jgi:GR25 family glycosyltransferase involved in LPS biosynthesis
MINCFIITLENSERYDYICQQILNKNLKFHFMLEPHGSNLNLLKLASEYKIKFFPFNYHVNFNKLYDFNKNKYIAGTLGCVNSHYNTYKKIIDMDLDYALILEDNIIIPDDIDIQINNILNNINTEWDIIHLFSSKPIEEINKRVLYKNNIYHGKDEWYTSKAQLVSKKYVNLMYKLIPYYHVADGITMIPSLSYYNTKLKSFAIYPNLIEINKKFSSIRVKIDQNKDWYNLEFKKTSLNNIYLLYFNNISSYNNLSVYIHINCVIAKKDQNKYIAEYKLVNYNSDITPNDIIKNLDEKLYYNNTIYRINSNYIINNKSNDDNSYYIYYLTEHIMPTIENNINDQFNVCLINLKYSI